MEKVKQKTFRTMYHQLGYDDREVNTKESITDPSGYIPTEQLINRFTRGEIVPMGGTEGYYEEESDYTDPKANDKAYARHEAELNARQEFSKKGEEAIAVEQKARIEKIAKAKALKKEKQKEVKAAESAQQKSSAEPTKAAPESSKA